MLLAGLMIALLLATPLAAAPARAEGTIVMKRSSEPGEAGELYVFVGEQVSYLPLDMSCKDCWIFDTWHKARYRVAEWIHGVPPGPELEFDVAEHATLLPFGHSRYSLVFVERHGDALALVKYQQVPVYPTADGSFASCGPPWGLPQERDGPLDPGSPPLSDVEFSPRLVVDDARRFSAFGRAKAHDARWHEVVGAQVLCRKGIPVSELVPAMVREHDMLKQALPELLGAAQ